MARLTLPVVVVGAAALAAGCSYSGDRPKLAEVEGVVTLDGQPASGVLVRFEQEGFRASQGLTDGSGRYRLRYIREIMGAAVGSHKVTFVDNTPKKRLPPRYAKQPLDQVVKSGANEINFELRSKG